MASRPTTSRLEQAQAHTQAALEALQVNLDDIESVVVEFYDEWRSEAVALADANDIRDFIRRIALAGAHTVRKPEVP